MMHMEFFPVTEIVTGVRELQYQWLREDHSMEGVCSIPYKVSEDVRGISSCFYEKGWIGHFITTEIFVSSSRRNVIRGMHFQPSPYGQKKLITVLAGKIEGVILDLRPASVTYLHYETVELSEHCGYSVLVPEDCAWGFAALEDMNTIMYNISGKYEKEHDCGIRWDSFGYDWKISVPVLSGRDAKLDSLEEYLHK